LSPQRIRLDKRAVELGLVSSRQEAQELIDASLLLVNGAVAEKASRQVAPSDSIVVRARRKYVSRGGLKLDGALERFGIDVSGRRGLDVGCSTGGFIHSLLTHGATEIIGVDVGRAQIHAQIASDPRVRIYESTDIRAFSSTNEPAAFSLITVDVSFISLRGLLDVLGELLGADGDLVALVKPQFEVGHKEASAGEGVITDPGLWHGALRGVVQAAEQCQLVCQGIVVSPLRGTKGNVEFFAHLRHRHERDDITPDAHIAFIEAAVAEATRSPTDVDERAHGTPDEVFEP
jgi:23S rRNA (cytidine1920-2'-O)/16S rRNA (cytidine1409-2'-O)-methyltransferase